MQRLALEPRPNWQKRVESHGLLYHTLGGEPYWDETACYQFRSAEIDNLELATEALHRMCLDVVVEVIQERSFGLFLIPPEFEEMVVRSWEEQEPSIYGRFDLAYDGSGPPRLLEYNADTPTALVEAAVAQWFWVQDHDPRGDQFNSIHERLIDGWKALRERDPSPIHFSALSGVVEDYVTVEYLRDTAIQAGFETDYLDVEQVGWDGPHGRFVDRHDRPIERLFKLYPWEWLVRDEFGQHIPRAATRWVEPAWKMILSCKSILPLLYDRYPDSPYLVPASFEPSAKVLGGRYVRKPVHGREGSNIQVVVDGRVVHQTGGPYDDGPFVYQQLVPVRPFDGRYPVLGTWVINGVACGMGIREDGALITQNTSRFLPHLMVS
jgi:glutathionylspermidine synthase